MSFAVGFVAASPFGPIGLLCLRRAFSRGIMSGAISALGICCAYAFWAYVALRGVAFFANWIERERQALEIGVGLFFLLYGLHALVSRPKTDYPELESNGFAEFASTFSVVFLNPATLAMFVALFSLFGVARGHSGGAASIEAALAVFLGAASFWAIVFQAVKLMRKGMAGSDFATVQRLSAFAIMAFGGVILLHAVVGMFP